MKTYKNLCLFLLGLITSFSVNEFKNIKLSSPKVENHHRLSSEVKLFAASHNELSVHWNENSEDEVTLTISNGHNLKLDYLVGLELVTDSGNLIWKNISNIQSLDPSTENTSLVELSTNLENGYYILRSTVASETNSTAKEQFASIKELYIEVESYNIKRIDYEDFLEKSSFNSTHFIDKTIPTEISRQQHTEEN